jgi:predicted metal-dependent peptidase
VIKEIFMDYNLLLQKLKNDNYPELKETAVELKPTKILGKVFMITLPFSKNIFYNEKIIKKCNDKALKAVLLHELYHIIQFKRL